ncbi:MAG: hypothetical protein SWX82_21550 [Cyanobacteriota bacterium]|nr:hypothetical protein [Cyanobacteriota bacterium]
MNTYYIVGSRGVAHTDYGTDTRIGHFSYQLSVISYQYLCNKEA